jgi:hypothetical protein
MVSRPALLAAALALAACAAPPPPGPAREDSAALAVSIRTVRPNEASRRHATAVLFVRVEGDGDPIRAEPVIDSNHESGGLVYLLDAEPGTYAAVASTEKHDGRTYLNYFPAELIRKTLTKVEAGGFAYMGTVDLDVIRIGGSHDAAQRHFEALLAPRYRSKSVAYRIFDRSRFFLGKKFAYRRDDPAREAKAREHLAAGGWSLK